MRTSRRSLLLLGAALVLMVSGIVVGSSASASTAKVMAVGRYTLINVNSGKCLEIAFEGRWDFNGANQYQCTGRTNQQWTIENPNDDFTISVFHNVNSGKCLEVGFSGLSDFNAVNQYQCTGNPNQQWVVTQVA